jgi:hypothetical protein
MEALPCEVVVRGGRGVAEEAEEGTEEKAEEAEEGRDAEERCGGDVREGGSRGWPGRWFSP